MSDGRRPVAAGLAAPGPRPAAKAWPDVSWYEGPAAAPVVVLGNSLGTTATVWDAQLLELTTQCRVLRYELPGHGGFRSWPGPYSIDELGRGLFALLDARDLDRVGYCGISLGGMIGMWLAANAPDRVEVLGLVCTSARMTPASAWHDRAAKVRQTGLASVSGHVVPRWFTSGFAGKEPAVISAYRAGLENGDAEGYTACCEAIAAMDLLRGLAAVTLPTLVIAGAQDHAAPPEHAVAIADRIPRLKVVVILAASHLATVSSPDQVSAAIVQHLGTAKSASRSWRAERWHALR